MKNYVSIPSNKKKSLTDNFYKLIFQLFSDCFFVTK